VWAFAHTGSIRLRFPAPNMLMEARAGFPVLLCVGVRPHGFEPGLEFLGHVMLMEARAGFPVLLCVGVRPHGFESVLEFLGHVMLMEARAGFEPANDGFANRCLSQLGDRATGGVGYLEGFQGYLRPLWTTPGLVTYPYISNPYSQKYQQPPRADHLF
jgi:hypothetical protein